MPIKFWQTIIRVWFFLSYLITTVALLILLCHLYEVVAYDDASNPHDFIRYIPDGRMNCHIEAKNRAGIGSWHGFRDGSGDYRIDEAQWAGQGEEEKNEIRHLSDQSLEKKIHIHDFLLLYSFLKVSKSRKQIWKFSFELNL